MYPKSLIRLAIGLAACSFILTELSCGRSASIKSESLKPSDFSIMAERNPIPFPDSASDLIELKIPGCNNGWNFKIRVPFKSLDVFEFYKSKFQKMGLDSNTGATEGDYWAQLPFSNHTDSGALMLTTQRAFSLSGKSVKCSVALFYMQSRKKSLNGDSVIWDKEAQTVSAVCGPELDASGSSCPDNK